MSRSKSENHRHHYEAATTTRPHHQDTTTTKEHLHALYTSACDELGTPDKATNSNMQHMASEIYQDILSYADHLMAILRILTLAKNTTTKSGRQAKTPLTQLLYLVSRGWTLDQGQHNQMQEGMSCMGLAICLTQLLTHAISHPSTSTTSTGSPSCSSNTTRHSSSASEGTVDTTYMPHNLLTRRLSTQPTTASTN